MVPDPFEIVRDSSVWVNPEHFEAVDRKDMALRVGIVKQAFNDTNSKQLRFWVEVRNFSDKIQLNCQLLRHFGGAYNYEDFVCRGYRVSDRPDPSSMTETKAGDVVLVGQLNGNGREGIILGGLTHAAHQTSLAVTDGPQYKAEFNGIETFINKDGEFKLTFKGLPTNIARLDDLAQSKIMPPTYNTKVGGSYYKFDKTGGWMVTDAALSNPQLLKIDKANGIVHLISGAISLTFTKKTESVDLVADKTTVKTKSQFDVLTKECRIKASKRAYVQSEKIAIGKSGVELLDQLAQLIDKLGTIVTTSPVGPCTPLNATAQWVEIENIKTKIKEITGTF